MGLQWRQHAPGSLSTVDPRSNEPSRWFAVQIWTRREAVSAEHLRLRGYEVFLPSYCATRRWSDRIKKVVQPVFEGYLFCRTQLDVCAKIVTTPGVIRIVGDGHTPTAIPDAEIAGIQRVVDSRVELERWPYVHMGDRVQILSGPLRGLEGIAVSVRNGSRLIVSVSLLQRSVAVDIAPEWIGTVS